MGALNVDRAVEALNGLLNLDQEFRLLLTNTVDARGRELDQYEVNPQLQRAQEEITKALLTLRESYRNRVVVPVKIQETSSGFLGILSCGCADAPRAEGNTTDQIVRLLQTSVDER